MHIPAMPRPYFPDYQAWKESFDPLSPDASTKLASHSAGAEFLLRWYSEQSDAEAEHLVLVAPYRDEAGKYGDFSEYDLDNRLIERVGRITIFNSLDDSDAIQRNSHRLVDALNAELVELDGYGHFMTDNNMTGPEFPELYDVLAT